MYTQKIRLKMLFKVNYYIIPSKRGRVDIKVNFRKGFTEHAM